MCVNRVGDADVLPNEHVRAARTAWLFVLQAAAEAWLAADAAAAAAAVAAATAEAAAAAAGGDGADGRQQRRKQRRAPQPWQDFGSEVGWLVARLVGRLRGWLVETLPHCSAFFKGVSGCEAGSS